MRGLLWQMMQEPHLPGGRDPPVGVTNPPSETLLIFDAAPTGTKHNKYRKQSNSYPLPFGMTEIPPLRLSSIFYFNIPQTFCASGCTSAGAKCRCGRSIFPPHQKRGNFLLTRIVICGILIKRLRDTVRRSGGTGRRPGLKIPWE